MRSQVTTGRGDEGMTVALDGREYSKAHPIMECVGTLDELRTQLALARLLLLRETLPEAQALADTITWLLHVFFAIGAECSDPLNRKPEFHRARIGEQHLAHLEAEQQRLESQVQLPRKFIVGAANLPAAQMDVACAVARRFERNLVRLKNEVPEFSAGELLAFINRLSDFLYVAARWLDNGDYQTVDYSRL
ncbi:MAG TPA: ATP:cob(I)alamin adenosyltransferase [Candidatus Hydrogenedentes bacterium]|nr:ATP:cob(I)alamin adenosyltransferase [Candidatus Hydrogenedentota bacterium]HOL77800.1 ATP:cob(I)alamin adenosyltransferase [Candidatus Hydrogenedentota bacterium]HPO86862.1 ATP:cob(I)alamin adenosyltransferase [Candidatus Hydrogenedentota bacterium]